MEMPVPPASSSSRSRELPGVADAERDIIDAKQENAYEDAEGTTERYNRWILDLIRPGIRGKVLEIGAGTGNFSAELRALGSSLTAVEPSVRLGKRLRERVAHVPSVTVVEGVLSDVTDRGFDAAVMLNVLEHIEDEEAVLGEVLERLTPGGTLSIWVPAFEFLYSDFDKRVGHFRRYRRPQLVNVVSAAGFTVRSARYVNLPGFFAWWLTMRASKVGAGGGRLTDIYDRVVVPVTSRVEKIIHPPFGLSVLLVAERPRDGGGTL
jgi:2-polyprenyl-3-methyl-5-hydroxy-6-metoxy-1,4-benzoquinol methylase